MYVPVAIFPETDRSLTGLAGMVRRPISVPLTLADMSVDVEYVPTASITIVAFSAIMFGMDGVKLYDSLGLLNASPQNILPEFINEIESFSCT